MFSAGTLPVRVSLPCSAAMFVPSALAAGHPRPHLYRLTWFGEAFRRGDREAGAPQCPLEGAGTAGVFIRDRTASTISAGAFDGDPVPKGGWGSYSMPSWTICASSGP